MKYLQILSKATRLIRSRFHGVSGDSERIAKLFDFPWLGKFSIDVVLAVRALRKSWGITFIGGLAITIVIAVAAGLFSFFQVFTGGTVPLDEGDRVVAIRSYYLETGQPARTAPADYERWRDELESVDTVGAFRTARLGMVGGGGPNSAVSSTAAAELVSVAEMTASGFELARVTPLLGRPLVDADERASAPPVVVIGEAIWRSRFASDPEVLGKQIRLGDLLHTVVGVMPEDFGFPINHRYWVPLRSDLSTEAWRTGADILVFGRLVSGFTLDGAQAELSTMGLLSDGLPTDRLERGRPSIVPYARAFIHMAPGDAAAVLLFVSLLLILPCANIAILIYARTVTRQGEFAARFALGASRGRIVGQIFIETVVLATLSALAALVFVQAVLSQVEVRIDQSPGATPFWMDAGISFQTILYVFGLVVLAALIAGVVPALRATKGLMDQGLRALTNRVSVRLGSTWTALVVLQIALAVAILPSATELTWGYLRPGMLDPGIPTSEFATMWLEVGDAAGNGSEPIARIAELQQEYARRLRAEGFLAVAFSTAIVGVEPSLEIYVEERSEAPRNRRADAYYDVNVNRISADFVDALGVQMLAGRQFEAGDFRVDSDAVIVNRTFARSIFGEASPLGRRIRYIDRGSQIERWYDIVGIATDLPANDESPRMYHPLEPGRLNPVTLTLRTQPDQIGGMIDRLQQLATRVGPRLSVTEIASLHDTYTELRAENASVARALVIVMTSVLLLSAAGMFALMSFTVNQRRRDIGIRMALGADSSRLLVGVFRRALCQVATGALAGLFLAILLGRYVQIDQIGGRDIPGSVWAVATFMMFVGCLAATGPAWRALRVEPTETLREDG